MNGTCSALGKFSKILLSLFFPLDDVSDVVKDNILLKLAKPYSNAGTSRTQATLKFDIDFSEYESKFGRIL